MIRGKIWLGRRFEWLDMAMIDLTVVVARLLRMCMKPTTKHRSRAVCQDQEEDRDERKTFESNLVHCQKLKKM